MIEKTVGISDRFPNLSAPTTTATEEIAMKIIILPISKLKTLLRKLIKRIRIIENMNLFNVVSENGDSIYYATLFEEQVVDGQIFVEPKIEEIVNRIIDQRLRPTINNSNRND